MVFTFPVGVFEAVCVGSVSKEPDCCSFVFRWVAGNVRDFGIGSGRFPVDVEGKGIVISSNGDV
jgi:hypothetical protein